MRANFITTLEMWEGFDELLDSFLTAVHGYSREHAALYSLKRDSADHVLYSEESSLRGNSVLKLLQMVFVNCS